MTIKRLSTVPASVYVHNIFFSLSGYWRKVLYFSAKFLLYLLHSPSMCWKKSICTRV